jgi:hypothetical protein
MFITEVVKRLSRKATGRGLAVLVTLTMLFLSAVLPGLPWSSRMRYALKRTSAKIGAKLASWRGLEPKPFSLSGRLIVSASLPRAVKGAQVAAVESTSGYAAMSDGEGRFILPHLIWYPGTVYNLIVTADVHQAKAFKISAPSSYPAGGVFRLEDMRLEDGYEIERAEWPVRYLEYDAENADYYKGLFNRLTSGAATDHQKVAAICRYVATKHNPGETRWQFQSARQILEGGAPHCSNLAFAMAAVTGAGGYPTRTVHTSDTPDYSNIHVAVEVHYDDSWHLYDPTYGVFFLDAKGAVAGYKELRMAPDLVVKEAFGALKRGVARTALTWMPGAYRSGLHQIYYVNESSFALWCSG